jgi:hypothetical protein
MDPVPLKGEHPVTASIGQHFQIVKAEGERGPFKVSTIEYFYSIGVLFKDEHGMQAEEELVNYQWTPNATGKNVVTYPHLHAGIGISRGNARVRPDTFHKIHLPTSRVSIEAFIRLVIVEFRAQPLKPKWNTILANSEKDFDDWKTR